MSELSINFSQGDSLKTSSSVQKKTEQLKNLLNSFKAIGENSKSTLNGDLFKDINKLSHSIDKLLNTSQNPAQNHQSFIEISQTTLEFFTKHEHEMLFEQFEELNDFAKKRKKKPSMQEFITASLQHVGVWTLNTNQISTQRVSESNNSPSTSNEQKGKQRHFSSVLEQSGKDNDVNGKLNYIPAELIPRLPQNNLGEILAFSIAQDVSFESFHTTHSGGQMIQSTDISSQAPTIMATSMSVDEIYDAISAILNKVILTEDDIFRLLQLLSEGGLQLIGIMPQTEVQDIINTIDDSIQDIAQKSTSLESIMALLAHIQQFSGTDIGQLANIPKLEESFSQGLSTQQSGIQNSVSLNIEPLYDDDLSEESNQTYSLNKNNEPDAIDEQVAGAQSISKKTIDSISVDLHSDKVQSIKDLGSTLLKLSHSKQEQFADKMLETLINVMTKKLDQVLDSSLDAFDNLNLDV
tara:strand:- start:840 stop:2237 length:1398 start_codon:yes stop_codon:yes gene_type:complete